MNRTHSFMQTASPNATYRQRLRAVSDHREFITVPSPHSLDERVDRGQQLRWRRGQVEGVAVDGDVGAITSTAGGEAVSPFA